MSFNEKGIFLLAFQGPFLTWKMVGRQEIWSRFFEQKPSRTHKFRISSRSEISEMKTYCPFFLSHGTPEKHWNTEKNAVVWDPYFLIRHNPRITKIPIWKYFMCILARNFDISVLCTEKLHEFDRKRGIFSI